MVGLREGALRGIIPQHRHHSTTHSIIPQYRHHSTTQASFHNTQHHSTTHSIISISTYCTRQSQILTVPILT
ncbi:hypothetical protein ACOMHN_026141 [Nucella lapillus]